MPFALKKKLNLSKLPATLDERDSISVHLKILPLIQIVKMNNLKIPDGDKTITDTGFRIAILACAWIHNETF